MSRGSSRGRVKGKGTIIRWEGHLGLDFFEKALYERFPVESKSDFTKEAPLRRYNEQKEEWPKCMHGEDCLVQMFTEGIDGDRCFFKCPRAWVIVITICLLNMFLDCTTTYKTYLLQSSESEENRGFTRWVDPRPIYLHQQYIYYPPDRIFELEREVSSGYKDDEDDNNNNGAGSQEALCNDPYCICPNHKNKGPLPPHHHHHHQ